MDKKILIGKKAIMDHIGIKGDDLFYSFLDRGMPHLTINNRLYAYTENIDSYFKSITNKKIHKKPPVK